MNVRVHRWIPAPMGRTFEAWLDPAVAGRFLFATPSGKMIRAEVDPRVGGRFTFTDRRPEGEFEHTGEYEAIERPRRLVFSFSVPKFSPQSTRVSVLFAPEREGTEVELTHEGVLTDFAEKTAEGWSKILSALEKTVTAP